MYYIYKYIFLINPLQSAAPGICIPTTKLIRISGLIKMHSGQRYENFIKLDAYYIIQFFFLFEKSFASGILFGQVASIKT